MTDQEQPAARLALATCAALPQLAPDDQALMAALAQRGVRAEPVVWDDPTVDWAAYPHVLIRSTWDYTDRHTQFVEWTRRVQGTSTLLNPADVVAWNIDKLYLKDLEEVGLPIIPTIWLDPERHLSARGIHTRFPAFGEFVIKPTVSAGARDTGRYDASQTPSRMLAITHAKNLLGVGRRVMVQRYLRHVDTVGEAALVYVDGQLSHTVRKGPQLEGPYRANEHEGVLRDRQIDRREPTDAERALADGVVAELARRFPERAPLLYARVDLVPDEEGAPLILEVELVEPALYFQQAPGALDRFAEAVVARLGR